jgi:hypothetical protein
MLARNLCAIAFLGSYNGARAVYRRRRVHEVAFSLRTSLIEDSSRGHKDSGFALTVNFRMNWHYAMNTRKCS